QGTDQRVFMVMNAPAQTDHHDGEEDVAQCTTQAMETLTRCGLATTLSTVSVTTPSDFAHRYPATGGALYGRASHGWTASFQRRGLRTSIKGLYLAGGSVHPGPGVPMAALSGQMASECALMDFGLMKRSRRAAISGGTSMV
ncbi:MAG: CrtD protein, partial [Pseudomonadota bacterium]